MMMKIYETLGFNKVRVFFINNEIWFSGKDISKNLGYLNTRTALSKHVVPGDKQKLLRSQSGTLDIPNRGLVIINETGLYDLIFSSKLPQAKFFRRWVITEVLPSIRKYGSYIIPEKLSVIEADPEAAAILISTLKAECARLSAFHDALLGKHRLSITRLALEYNLSARELNDLLNKLNVQEKRNGFWCLVENCDAVKHIVTFKNPKSENKNRILSWRQSARPFIRKLLVKEGIYPITDTPQHNLSVQTP
jgi:prophage antirepressor-like protein